MSSENVEKEKAICKSDPRLYSGEFFIMPKSFVSKMSSLSDASIRIYLLFRDEFNWAKNEDKIYPTYEKIMEITGIKSRTTVRKAIIDLVENGWVRWVERKFSGNNRYYVNSVPEKNDAMMLNIESAKENMSKKRLESSPKVQIMDS